MTTKTLLSLATVSLLALAAKADTTYTVETTNSWFSVDAAEVSLAESIWGTVQPTREEDAEVIDVDTGANNPALYTMPAGSKPSATRYRVTGNMTVTLNAGEPAEFTGETLPKAALVAASVGGDNKWYGWDGDSWEDLSSEDLSSRITTEPEDGDSCNVAIEFFVESSQLKIKYIVGAQSATVTASGSALPTLSKVGLAGYGSFGDFGALGFDSFEVTTTKTEQQLKDAGLVVAQGQSVVAALNSEGKNGLPQWQSLALGINPNTTTKPYTAPVQTNNGDLGFTIGNYGTPSVDGNVTFDVYECDAEGVIINETPVGSAEAGTTATVEAPSGVKYYKIKITFE